MLLGIKYVFRFYLQLLPEASLILRRTEKDMIKSVFIQYNPTNCAFSKLIFLILISLVSSTCFEPEGSSSGRRFYTGKVECVLHASV